jgi:SpoVK/Ycf46/Vps4 family AAA+-type ATPase
MTDLYRDGREHLAGELQHLDALLRLKVRQHQQNDKAAGGNPDIFKGLYIPDEEIDRITQSPGNNRENSPNPDADEINNHRQALSKKIENSLDANVYLPLYHLASLFNLNRFELDTLLICLALELEVKYGKLYAYLQDDVTKKYPSVDFILDLLCTSSSPDQRIEARRFFMDRSPLFDYHLVKFSADTLDKPLLTRFLKLDERIVNFLLGFNQLDSRVSSFAAVEKPATQWASLIMDRNIKKSFLRLAGEYIDHSPKKENNAALPRLVFYLRGPYGVGKKSAAQAFCSQLNLPLLTVDIRDLFKYTESSAPAVEQTVKLLFRETLLQGAAIYIKGLDRLTGDGNGTDSTGRGEPGTGFYLDIITRAIEEFSFITFLAGENRWRPRGKFSGPRFIALDFPPPAHGLRKKLWQETLPPSQLDIDALANTFNFTAGQIKDAAAEAGNLSLLRANGGNGGIGMEDLYQACRSQSNRKLAQMARKIEPCYTWEDIVLPTDTMEQLKEIRGCMKYRHVVYGDWGFDRKISLGKGLSVLFSGPSGTGKTMAAEVIANELGIDLYKIDLSSVVSKYIGETEKNLAAIFREAETANSILFFDEADALFGKRSEVKDSHDRYANIEIGYLLQRMEEYDGVVILATNMKNNMDEAFVRRMQFTVDFPFPDEIYRLRIWTGIFPAEAPLADGIDYDFLSKNLTIAGGNIKNIALAAAFYAAGDSQPVTMEHLIHACKREFQKMGKLCLKSDFGEYYRWLQSDEQKRQ